MRLPGLSSCRGFSLALIAALLAGAAVRAQDAAPASDASPADSAPSASRPARTWLEAQIALARRRFSCGPIDGVGGPQTVAALKAFQTSQKIPVTGLLDDPTRLYLLLDTPAYTQITLTAADLARLQPLSPTWLGKSQQTALEYETALDLIAERSHASPGLIRQLNPAVDWSQPEAGTSLTVPDVALAVPDAKAGRVVIRMADHVLEVIDTDGDLVAHFPVSIAHMVEKRPEGTLEVTSVVSNPSYTFDPAVFPESEEAQQLGHKLVLPPGPKNPVGVAWIGLDLPGYGIHGTPEPSHVGRTESHGCFRLANWDAQTLLDLAWIGMPVVVQP
jgi:lipoprotein-anchoring transpeptidase ErfK/SrfK